MDNATILQHKKNIKIELVNLNWADNPDIQKLLDVISSIIADEYIQIAKENVNVFKNGGEK